MPRSIPPNFGSEVTMKPLNLNNAEFIKSAATPEGFLNVQEPCVVFSGKSNVGKSSVINRILNRKNFARVGAHPGKTIHINYFRIDNQIYLIDLPGYGYASVAKSERDRWGKMMERFFSDPGRVTLGVMIVDARHTPTKDDETMAAWFRSVGCPLIVVANKIDKLKKSEIEPNMHRIRETLQLSPETLVLPFSAEKGTGRDELVREILSAL